VVPATVPVGLGLAAAKVELQEPVEVGFLIAVLAVVGTELSGLESAAAIQQG